MKKSPNPNDGRVAYTVRNYSKGDQITLHFGKITSHED